MLKINFNIGDKVKVINNGKTYTTYLEKAEELGASLFLNKEGSAPKNNSTGEIVNFDESGIYLVKIKNVEHLIGKEGLKLIEKKHMIKSDNKIKESESGFKKDNPEEKVRFDLIPYETLERLAKQFTGGAKKYGFENWKKANTPEQIHGFKEAAERHTLKWVANIDDGEDHAAAAMTNIMMYEWLTNHQK